MSAKKQLTICLVMAGSGKGGLETHFIDLCNDLAQRHIVHAITQPEFADQFEKPVHIHPLPLNKNRNSPVLLLKLTALLRKLAPDVIHAHANKAVSLIARCRLGLPKSIKAVGTLHNKKKRLGAFEKMDFVIGVSHAILQDVKNQHKRCIHNGIHVKPERIRPRSYLERFFPGGDVPDHPVIVNLGRLVPAKRIDLSLKAMQKQPDASLLIVGDGPERKALETLRDELSLKNVYFTGFQSDAFEILSAADLCLITSGHEGFSYVMLESLMGGTPVLATDVADMKIILPEGYVIAQEDEAGLNRKLTSCLKFPEKCLDDFQETFAWARENLTHAEMVRKIENVYQTIS